MEARSLTALNELAANPPQYPERPLDDKQEPLVLYISRVPGTRDVILSPVRPQPVNVTGEDIANSLYYIHLEMPTDESFRNGSCSSESRGRSPLTIPRKPVPDAALPLTPESLTHQAQQLMLPPTQSSTSQSDSLGGTGHVRSNSLEPKPRQDIGDGQSRVTAPENYERTAAGLHKGVPARKPLSIRSGEAPTPSSPGATKSPVREYGRSSQPNGNVSFEGPRPGGRTDPRKPPAALPLDALAQASSPEVSDTRPMPISSRPISDTQSRSPSPRQRALSSSQGLGAPFTLTLIRRDPSSGRQWNVGRVVSRQMEQLGNNAEQETRPLEASSPTSTPAPSPYPSIDIKLETSGYAKFRNAPLRKNRLEVNTEERPQMKEDVGVFTRQVEMAYCKSLTAVIGNGVREFYQRLEQAGRAKIGRHRSDSVASAVSNASDTREMPDTVITSGPPPQGMKARGYVFNSPWDGKCVFTTGPWGRSLHCRHVPDGTLVNDALNPLMQDLNGTGILGQQIQPLSELRFSLPSSELLAEHAKSSKEQLKKANFGKLLRPGSSGNDSATNDDADDDYVSPFHGNLGSERAGGGANGRRAKMGKLIVHDDGLKMLDLVVAANVGIWWAAWERGF